MAERTGMTVAEAHAELARVGLPILAASCHVAVANPQKWFD